MSKHTEFNPNWVSPPGNTIIALLAEKNLSVDKFIEIMGNSHSHTYSLLNGYKRITERIAVKLSKNLGGTPKFWMNRETQYRKDLNRLNKINKKNWLDAFPYREILKYGWINESKNPLDTALSYFSVPDLATWKQKYGDISAVASYRKSSAYETNSVATSAWIRRGEILSESIDCQIWDEKSFKESLPRIKELTTEKNPSKFLPKLQELCAECGVPIVIARTPKGCPASGATKFKTPDKPMILLSFRFKSDDQFWFTFFHEAAHLLLHDKGKVFIETDNKFEGKDLSTEEKEANEFAGDILIPKNLQNELKNLKLEKRSIIRFAWKAGVSPGIVIGQLQHYGIIDYRHFNGFKRYFEWEDILIDN